MAALQVTDSNITALVGGDYLNADGTVKESYRGIIDTTASRVAALVEQLAFDTKGHVTNIDRSGLVLESTWAAMFSDTTDENGTVVARAQISTLIDDGVSKAVIKADQVEIDGTVKINQYITADKNGNLTLGKKTESGTYDVNALTVYGNGEFTGTVNATSGVFSNIHSPGKNDADEYYFAIDQEGKLTVNEAVVRGTIYATDGEFSGKIDATSGILRDVTVGSGDGQLIISKLGDAGYIGIPSGTKLMLSDKGYGLYGNGGTVTDKFINYSVTVEGDSWPYVMEIGANQIMIMKSGGIGGFTQFLVKPDNNRLSAVFRGLPTKKNDADYCGLYIDNGTIKINI